MKMIISILLTGFVWSHSAISMEYKTPKVKKSPSESTIQKSSVLETAREFFSRRAGSDSAIKPNHKTPSKASHKSEDAPEKPTFSQALASVKEESVCLMNTSRRRTGFDPDKSIMDV